MPDLAHGRDRDNCSAERDRRADVQAVVVAADELARPEGAARADVDLARDDGAHDRDSERAAALVKSLDIPTLRAGCYSDAGRAPAILPAVFIRDGLLDLL